MLDRLTHKREEWKHDEEWRFITGQVGCKYYLDDALTRVYVGPRADPRHVARLIDVLDQRPVEILQGHIHGFDLTFHTIKQARPLENSERVGAGILELETSMYAETAISDFLSVPLDEFVRLCRDIAKRPNMEKFFAMDVATGGKEIYVTTIYKLRNGRETYHNLHFDHRLRLRG